VQELRLLETVIKDIHQKEREYGLDPMLTLILHSVSMQMDKLLAIMAKNQVGLSSNSRIVRIRSSFQGLPQKQLDHAVSTFAQRNEGQFSTGTIQSV
jgi:predicted transcriptional regulator